MNSLFDMLDNPLVLFSLCAACGGLMFYALVYPFLSGEHRAEKRLKTVSVTLDRSARPKGIDMSMRKKQVAETLKDLENKQKANSRMTLQDRIQQAGLNWSLPQLFLISLATGVLSAGLAFLIKKTVIAAVVMFPVGLIALPFLYISHLRKKRIKKFVNEFPNAMDVIVRGVKSGLPIGDCLRIIGNEATEPVRSEFKHIVEIQQLGVSVSDACAELYKRIPVPEANFFGIVIQIQQKAGGNLSEVLGNLSKVIRERRKMKAKIIAMSTEATASASIIAALPFIVGLLVYLSSPAYVELLWMREAGQKAMMVSGVWMVIGVFVMKKMINFDI